MKQVIRLSLMVSVLSNWLMISVKAQNAFSDNIDFCLFKSWRSGRTPVLAEKIDCSGPQRKGLCYGIDRVASFAVCYNTVSRIPEITGHSVFNSSHGTGREAWRNEHGRYAPYPESDVFADYDPYIQRNLFQGFDVQKQHYYSRGHLTPNNDFSTDAERELTMINTNVAPQWQEFNSQNWVVVESAVQAYSKSWRAYVFTGTGGSYQIPNVPNQILKLNENVYVPKYYWKVICDPVARSSIAFYGISPFGWDGHSEKKGGCLENQMSLDMGLVYCMSVENLKHSKVAKDWNLPSLAEACNPSTRGTFLDQYLNGWK